MNGAAAIGPATRTHAPLRALVLGTVEDVSRRTRAKEAAAVLLTEFLRGLWGALGALVIDIVIQLSVGAADKAEGEQVDETSHPRFAG